MGLPVGILIGMAQVALALGRFVRDTRWLNPEAIDCLCSSSQEAGREGVVDRSLSKVGQRLTAMREWWRGRSV